MPRPPSRALLHEIDPRTLAIDTTIQAIDAMWKDVLLLSPLQIHIPRPDDDEAASTDLAQTAMDLLAYAEGEGGYLPDEALEAVATVVRACGLYLTEDAIDPLEMVMLAAEARARIDAGRAPPAGGVAIIAGCSANHVRLLARAGEVDLGSAKDVRRWLSSRRP